MTDTSSSTIWSAAQRPDTFESRSHRFREEMRPVFCQWLGISPESKVLDGGCGSGVFTRYLAQGLTTGHITGFDINPGFVEYGRRKARELGLADKMTLEPADGFALHYEDSTFDAVTNYTYVGVLSDPEAGLRELIRVCRPGGVVSCVIAANSIPNIGWQGDYPFDGAEELQGLAALENTIFVGFAHSVEDWKQSSIWNPCRYPKLFELCGLTDISMAPFGHLLCYNDAKYPLEYRRQVAITETQEEIDWLKSRYSGKESIYVKHGFARGDFERLVCLLQKKLDYFEACFALDNSYEWHGGFNFIVTGKKANSPSLHQ
jgi:SAM-dependent methyltransferase